MQGVSTMATNSESCTILDKRKHPFGDLGKPTLRGVRKCPKCGTFNGTRGISCKNKDCDVVFKERERKKGHSAESVKIITESTSQLYSVRLRDRGPDYRGFVQLPYIQDMEGNPAPVVDHSMLTGAAMCYVESCNRNAPPDPNSILKGTAPTCVHVRSAIDCTQQAQPITLKNEIFNNLQISNEMKQSIWLLATETSGPVVQRVTKNIMVVKCKITSKQPLGFLHCAFFETIRNRQHPDYKFQCSCRTFKMRNSHAREDVSKRCVHFYACICAFASDEKLSKEFAPYMNPDQPVMTLTLMGSDRQVLTMYQPIEESLAVPADADTMEFIISEEDMLVVTPDKKVKKEDPVAQASSALLTLQEQKQPSQATAVLSTLQSTSVKQSSHTTQFQIQQQQQPQQQLTQQQPAQQQTQKSTPKKLSYQSTVDENTASISFQQWLASVTERINQTMHYGFSGTPDPLVFHAPQVFFDCLQQRISTGTRKKRLPNYITSFVRKEALPLGNFTKYTWHITNIMQVKQIFDSQDITLDLSRSFVENRDGTYDPYEAPRPDVYGDASKIKNHLPIRPFELKTYLKVGPTADQKEPVPFIIEWIPDILPRCHIGELRIKFEYGHQRNGQIENRTSSSLPSSDVSLHPQAIQLREIIPS
ncbi:uncharacterized protein C2orf42 homolog isoform X2 [Aplysia californica]|uniref:Uncharacterized protein C2orf42 homolog isoform X1 n=1 Tax=Aplysia californica TaxID=6500 RepID=A0ABM0JIA3_APLCA|nr:uncharacterized protein C2orf42 homolog isoform X1 [Aplysia californica]XP_005094271.1 uncharacterized protein C2orf42 homolog isoform X2 [Aplysia californica]